MESPIASVRVLDVRHLSQTTLYLSVPFTYSSFSGCTLQSNDLRVSLALVANRRIRVMCRQRADRLMMMSLRRPKRGRFHMVKCVRHWYGSRMFGVGYDARKWRGSSTRSIFDHRATAAATAPVGSHSRGRVSESNGAMAQAVCQPWVSGRTDACTAHKVRATDFGLSALEDGDCRMSSKCDRDT